MVLKKKGTKKIRKNSFFRSCGRVARQSSAKAFTPVRIWSGPHRIYIKCLSYIHKYLIIIFNHLINLMQINNTKTICIYIYKI